MIEILFWLIGMGMVLALLDIMLPQRKTDLDLALFLTWPIILSYIIVLKVYSKYFRNRHK